MSYYDDCVVHPKRMLENALAWLDEAEAYAKEKEFEPDNFVGLRLAPDMFAFGKQVQSMADSAKFLAARCAGKEAPKHEDDETTFAELRARLTTVVEYLGTFEESDFADADERLVTLSFLPPGQALTASDYIREMAYPNFYFHLTTAYAILRANGVRLGKRKYITHLTLRDA